MGRTIVFIGANIEPSLYETLQKKYPNDSDTNLILKGLQLLLENQSEQLINMKGMKDEIWNAFIKKSKEKNIELRDVVGELIYRWTKGEFKLWDEKP